MWQRAQTLYLAISTVLVFLLFFMPKAVVISSGNPVSFTSYIPYLILLILVTFLNVLALTTWNFRIFQMRTATLTAILTLALQIWLVVDFMATRSQATFKVFAIFPLIALIFDIMAIRGIFADQMLVESSASLRKSRRERRNKRICFAR